jgi:hypothetical protein
LPGSGAYVDAVEVPDVFDVVDVVECVIGGR